MLEQDQKVSLDYLVRYVCKIVSKGSGNLLGDEQHAMVTSRLKKRIMDLDLENHEKYFQYIKQNIEEESKHLISLLTTHHTFFFREFYHFEYILENINQIVENVKKSGRNKIKIYSAACSKGHEVYSLAMFFNTILKNIDPTMDFEILGTDIDEKCVEFAENGVYNYSEIKKIPEQFLVGHFERGKGKLSNFVRIKKSLKDKCQFYPANLFDPNHIEGQFDIIFCRNVFIYFDPKEISKVVDIFRKHLQKCGFFVTGLCESLKPLGLEELYHKGICIYSFDELEVEKKKTQSIDTTKIVPVKERAIALIPKPINLMIVDDSKSIQKILKKVFDKDPDFNVVCIANDGVEAEQMVKSHKIDAMTLDIHMPNKNGVEYLRDNFSEDHPKVIVVSSASREDTEFSQKSIEYGASDFVEKPALNNITKRAEEIKTKLKMSFLIGEKREKVVNSVHKDFNKDLTIPNPNSKLRVIIANNASISNVTEMCSHFDLGSPPCVILFEGNLSLLDMHKGKIEKSSKLEVELFSERLATDKIYLADFDSFFEMNKDLISERKSSVSVFGIPTKNIEQNVLELENIHLLLEDIEQNDSALVEVANDVFPTTSFYYVSSRYLSES